MKKENSKDHNLSHTGIQLLLWGSRMRRQIGIRCGNTSEFVDSLNPFRCLVGGQSGSIQSDLRSSG
jgi:hypothetical protein